MSIINILIGGVGGQGLVLATKLLSETAFLEGYDVKTSDVIGLSQRGGKVFGSVRFGEKVYSPLIPSGEVDILLAMEKLEGLRYIKELKKEATVILNNYSILPNRALIEKDEYPENIIDIFKNSTMQVFSMDGLQISKSLGTAKVMNVLLLGKLSTLLPFKIETWHIALEKNVPQKMLDLNMKAFETGRLL